MVYFLIPVFNEQKNIPLLSQNLKNCSKIIKDDVYYVFVDDKSSDNTIELINNHFEKINYHIITKNKNAGPGDSFNLGFEWILNHCPDHDSNDNLVVTLEADNTSDLDILSIMISLAKMKFDLVLASVYAQGGGFEKTSFVRILLSFTANLFFRAFFNIKILTLSSFYRVYRISLLKKIQQTNKKIVAEKGFISMLEILIKAIKLQANLIEVPMILQSSNRKGKSKMKLLQTSLSYLKFLFRNSTK